MLRDLGTRSDVLTPDDIRESRITTEETFEGLKAFFGLSLDGDALVPCPPYIENSRVKSSGVVGLRSGMEAEATLFEHKKGASEGGPGVEERMLVTLCREGIESRWVVSGNGLQSYNSQVVNFSVNGEVVGVENERYPISGWLEASQVTNTKAFNKIALSLLETLNSGKDEI